MPSIRLVLSLCLVATTLHAGGCGKSEPRTSRSARNVPKKVVPKPESEVLVKVSEEEAREFAGKLERAFLAQDYEAFETLIDWEAIVARSTCMIPASKEAIREFNESAKSTKSIFLRTLSNDDPESTFRLVKIQERQGAAWATFRSTGTEGLRDYFGFLLTSIDGSTTATEVYRYSQGQTISQGLQSGARIAFVNVLSESAEVVDPRLAEYVRHRQTVVKMMMYMQQRQPHQALAAYDSLPPTLRKDKFLLLVRHRVATSLGGEPLALACRDLQEAYPNDPCIDFLMLRRWLEEGQTDKALAAIDRIDHAVGGDPYLNTLRANILVHSGQSQEARRRAELAVRELPDMADPYWSMVDVALLEKDHRLLSEMLVALQHRFHVDLSPVPLSPIYAEFLDSGPGREWLALQTGGMGTLR